MIGGMKNCFHDRVDLKMKSLGRDASIGADKFKAGKNVFFVFYVVDDWLCEKKHKKDKESLVDNILNRSSIDREL